ncbi:MAG TPA: hypothetical protein VGQ95_05175 [Chthoniobacterales bacterium]|nr:hypothetical protein [Chthoniobacterales bacterium]
MSRSVTQIIVALSIFGFAAGNVANADPISNFFRRLGNSMAHPQKKSGSRSKSTKQSVSKEESAPPTPGPSLGPPNQHNIRTGSAAPRAKGEKRDVPYAIPVPGKKGLVTSPFAPDAGYVDVSKFPPGTEVKDPFSDKIFRTP